MSKGARFRGRKTESFGQRRDDYGIDGEDIFPQCVVPDALHPIDRVFHAERASESTNVIIPFFIMAGRDYYGTESGDCTNGRRKGQEKVFQSFRNAGTTEEQGGERTVQIQRRTHVCDALVGNELRIPKIMIHSTMDRNELCIRNANRNTKAIFRIMGNTDVPVEWETKDQSLETRISPSSKSTDERLPESAKNLKYEQHDLLSREECEEACGNCRNIHGSM